MKIKDIKFKNDFITRCLLNEWVPDFDGNYKDEVRKIIRKATDTDDLVKKILADKRFMRTQVYCEIIRHYGDAWKFIRHMFGEKTIKTMSDAGGIKIGDVSGNMSIIIPNGRGDGVTRYAVLNNDEFYAGCLMTYFTMFTGKVNIYTHDCGNEVRETLDGTFFIYYYDGLIAFVME